MGGANADAVYQRERKGHTALKNRDRGERHAEHAEGFAPTGLEAVLQRVPGGLGTGGAEA